MTDHSLALQRDGKPPPPVEIPSVKVAVVHDPDMRSRRSNSRQNLRVAVRSPNSKWIWAPLALFLIYAMSEYMLYITTLGRRDGW